MEFKVNDYIVLRLEFCRTNIYINNRYFRQCKYLLLNLKKGESYAEISSIDEAAETLDASLEYPHKTEIQIPLEAEFWGHCSNLQAWAEHNYDTRLLHRNLAFPLLKKLTEVGDPVAKKVFKKEILNRIDSGHLNVIKYLDEDGYLNYVGKEGLVRAINTGSQELQEYVFKNHLVELIKLTPAEADCINYDQIKIKKLCLVGKDITKLPEWICKLDSLEKLNLAFNDLNSLPDSISDLKSLKYLCLLGNFLESVPESIGYLESLESLDLSTNYLTSIPESIGKLKSLKKLDLSFNQMNSLPAGINELMNKGIEIDCLGLELCG